LWLEFGQQLGRAFEGARLHCLFAIFDETLQILALGFRHRLLCHDIPMPALALGSGHRFFTDWRSWHGFLRCFVRFR
jgi:hypothetical protein